jgi:sn-glycerol 3-phosphate transport system substrate-binding protein
VWHILSPGRALDVVTEMFDEYEEVTGVEVDAEAVGSYDRLAAQLADTDPGAWPDLVIAPPGAARPLIDSNRFIKPGACADLDRLRADMLPVVNATYSFDGQLFALPFGVSAPVLYIDAARFRAAGLDPTTPPRTVDELMAASEQLAARDASPFGLILYDWVTQFAVEQYAAQTGVLIGSSYNGRRSGDVKVDFVFPEAIDALETYRAGVEAGHTLWIGQNVDNVANLYRLVDPVNGGAMTIHTSGSLGDILQLVEAGNFPGAELAVGPMPGPGPGTLAGGNGLWLVDNADPQRVGAAFELASWLTEPTQVAHLAAATGYIPFTRSAAAEPEMVEAWFRRPQLRVGYDQLVAARGDEAAAGLLIGPAADREFVLFATSTRIIEDGEDVRTALEEASAQVNQLIADYDASVDD